MTNSKTSSKSQDEWFLIGDFAEAAWEVSLDGVDQVMMEVEGGARTANVVCLPAPAKSLRMAVQAAIQAYEKSGKMLDAALIYASPLGWKVFPVPPGTKQSYIGHKSRFGSGENWGMTSDPELIKKYWKRWPDANVGLPTGWVNRIIVIETDKPSDGHKNLKADGEVSLKALEARLGPLPETLEAMSPSGSRHRYYSHPGPAFKVRNSASEIGDGVDVRGDGGMVIVPPSIRKDGIYRWLNKLAAAELPAAWITALTEEKSTPVVAALPADANWAERYGAEPDGEPPTLEELKDELEKLPNDDIGWERWNDVAMRPWPAAKHADLVVVSVAVDIGARLDQQSDGFEVTMDSREMEWSCVVRKVARIKVSTALNQEPNNRVMTAQHGKM